ncbi:conserved hypothetical protein [Pseudomonas serboccidentalis]
MNLQIIEKEPSSFATKRRGGGHTKVGRPVTWRTGAPEDALRMATINTQHQKGLCRVTLCAKSKPGYQTRSLIRQRPDNNRIRPKSAQAGGFWRSCRQRRKDV